MAREALDRKLRHLKEDVLVLDSLVETAIIESVEALKRRDLSLARRVLSNDTYVNAQRFNLENDIIVTIATQQPVMAGDLRMVASILEVVGELERIGDYAKGIATVTLKLGKQETFIPLRDISRMSELAVNMLHRAVGAFVVADAETARRIPHEDDAVDELYNRVYADLVSAMLADSTTIDRANYLMWAAHNLERVADRVTNICERTVYIATGQLVELEASDDETRVALPL